MNKFIYTLNRQELNTNLKIFKVSEIIYIQLLPQYILITNEQNNPENGIIYIKILYKNNIISASELIAFGLEYDKFISFISRLDDMDIILDIDMDKLLININSILTMKILPKKPNIFTYYNSLNCNAELKNLNHIVIPGKEFYRNINRVKNIFSKTESSNNEYNFIDINFESNNEITISATDTLRYIQIQNIYQTKYNLNQISINLKVFKNTLPLLNEILLRSDWIDCFIREKENIFRCENFTGQLSVEYMLILYKQPNYDFCFLPSIKKLIGEINNAQIHQINTLDLLKQIKLIQNIAKYNINSQNSIDLYFTKNNLKFEVLSDNEEHYVNSLSTNNIRFDSQEDFKILIDVDLFMTCVDIIHSCQIDMGNSITNMKLEVDNKGKPIIMRYTIDATDKKQGINVIIICSTFN